MIGGQNNAAGGQGKIWFPSYTNANFYGYFEATSGTLFPAFGVATYAKLDVVGVAVNATPITSITLTCKGGANFIAGSQFNLYGL